MNKQTDTTKVVIGRVEHIQLADFGDEFIPAKVDTGADVSSIWASQVEESAKGLSFVLFDKKSKYYTGKPIVLPAREYNLTRVENSFGMKQMRYVVQLRIRIHGRLVKTTFTLADRQVKTYPVLLGRRLLNRKFLVDVSKGEALKDLERQKKKELNRGLKKAQ